MQTQITINTDNQAFRNLDAESEELDTTTASEVARILRELADKIELAGGLPVYLPLHDANGNNCGKMETE